MGKTHLLLLSLVASLGCAAGSANAAYRITGMDLYGHGVVTNSQPFAPPVHLSETFHVVLDLFEPYPGNPYAPIPADATGTYSFFNISGPNGFDEQIRDAAGWAYCETCTANFSLVNGELSGPFYFSAGIDTLHYLRVQNSSFYGEVPGPSVIFPVSYSGTFALDRVVIHTDGPASVPEPATWALMIGGFGLAGAALRRRRATAATA